MGEERKERFVSLDSLNVHRYMNDCFAPQVQ